jgi:signal transduction histidine kinase
MASDDMKFPTLKPVDDDQRGTAAWAGRTVAARREFNANDFLAIVSHDIRTPLMAMIRAAGLIRAHAGGPGSARRVQRWAEDLLGSAGDMESLIADLEAGAIENGDILIARTSVDVAMLVGHVADAFVPLAEAKSIVLSRDIAAPLIVNCDAARLLQVLANLIDNAIQFTPAGGCIRVRAACEGGDCVVSVIDTGIGIPKAELTFIFMARRSHGPGDHPTWRLGLYCSRRIIEAHDGRMWAEGQVGVGSTFYCTLPMA